jgi:hypothetical protein
MKKYLFRRSMLCLLGAGALVAWPPLSPSVHSQQQDVKVALIAPISGAMARAGDLMRLGARLGD